MRQAKLPLKIGQFPIVENSTYTMELPRQYDYNSLMISVNGTLTNGGVNFNSVRTEAQSKLIRRVDLIADGTVIVQSWTGEQLAFANFERHRNISNADFFGESGPFPLTLTVDGTGEFGFDAYIDFDTINGVRPKDTSFRTNALTQWQLRVTFGTLFDMFTIAGANTGAGSAVVGAVTVASLQTVEYPDANGRTSNPAFIKRVSLQSYTIPNSNSALELRLNTGNFIKAISLRTTVDGEPTDGIINSIQLAAAQDVRANLSGRQLKAQHAANHGAPKLPGYYLLDFTVNGPAPARLADAWDVSSRLVEPKIILDVNGGANYKIDVATIEIQQIIYR